MSLDQVLDSLGDFAKDVRLNIPTLLSVEGAPGLTQEQIDYVGLSLAFATQREATISAIRAHTEPRLSAELVEAAKAAATVMAMNNVYYRGIHLLEDEDISRMPARLRMNVMLKSGAPKLHFELASFAISALNGCGKCLQAHQATLLKEGASKEALQSCLRLAGVIASLAQAQALT